MRFVGKFALLTGTLLLYGVPGAQADHPPGNDEPFMRGMVVSCPRGGQIWGSPQMQEALTALAEVGVEWISIHPYAGVRRDGTVWVRPATEADYLERAGALIRAAGMRIFWKPHLAYWGSFAWRGAIDFPDEASWQRFFAGYRRFIVDQAELAESLGVELLALGVELEQTTHRPEWIELIDEVRRVYSGRLTYAANWDRLESVPFWERLDLIGVHAYFPLSLATEPDLAALEEGWASAFAALREFSETRGGKRVIFAEIGYNRSETAAAEPWSNALDDTSAARSLRQRLIELAISRVESEPLVAGMFWWKWIPGPLGHDRDFSMKDPEALEALRRHWAPPGRSSAR